MDIENLGQFIKKALNYYDEQKLKYYDIIKSDDIKFSEEQNEITINFKSNERPLYGEYEVLGYFDNQTRVWIWGWVLTNLNLESTRICKDLLNYGLKLEPSSNIYEHYFIKTLLVNSRILIEDSTQLDINLAIYSYLMRDRYNFIYPRKRYMESNNKDKYIIIYYLIKSNELR